MAVVVGRSTGSLALIKFVKSNIRPRSTVYNPDKSERLRMFDTVYENGSADFHSLVWARLVSGDFVTGNWETRREITIDEFQRGHPCRRFVSALHSIDSVKGTAIILIGEGDVPMVPRPKATRFDYSWRLWDLTNNRELEVLKRCDNPFDWYDANDDES